MMNIQEKSRSPPKLTTADFPLFWLVCLRPVSTQIVKGAESTKLALDYLGAYWYLF